MAKTVVVTQARMGSERLPGKHLLQVGDAPMLGHLIRRMKQIQGIDDIVIATTTNRMDDAIEELCTEYDVRCFRGSEHDVLGRTLEALQSRDADIAVQIYGDGPLFDPRLAEECLRIWQEKQPDWVGNDVHEGFPSGMFVEIYSVDALRRSAENTEDHAIREHVTLFLRTHPDIFTLEHVKPPSTLHRPEVHLDVDTNEDIAVFAAIMEHFGDKKDFSLGDILAFLDANPKIRKQNKNVHRRWQQYQKPPIMPL